MRRAAIVLLAVAGGVLGALAEQQGYAWTDLRGWLPDLLAGWTLIGIGIALLVLGRPRGAALLLLAAGFSWFAFNFATTPPTALEWVARRSAFLHRGPLLALALVLAAGYPRTRLAAAGIALAWAAAVAWPLWNNDFGALVLAAAFVAATATCFRRARGQRGRAIAGRALTAVVALAAVIAADAARSMTGAPQRIADVTVFGYAVAVAAAGILLFSAALRATPSSLVDNAVALEGGGMRLRDVLRELLGDRELEVAFADSEGTLVDDRGRRLAWSGQDRISTEVVVGERLVGVVVHDPQTLVDEPTRSAVLAAAALAAERARLREEVDRQANAVEASRQRLLLAEDQERRRLAETLDRGAGASLAELEAFVGTARTGADPELAVALDRAAGQIARARPELDALVRGLGGVEPADLVPALERLADDAPIAVELDLARLSVSREVASAIWFVCAESLSNVVKHSGASTVRLALSSRDGAVCLRIEDDGRGGADAGGSGLVGLADRVAAIGGRLSVDSPRGTGTRIVADLPLDEVRT